MMYASRALIGKIEPGLWAPPEAYEWYRVTPDGVGLVILSSGLQNLTSEEIERARANIAEGVKKLDAEGVDVIAVGGSPVVGYKGYNAHQELLAGLKKLTAIPLVTALTAEIGAMKELGMKRVVMAAPYPEEVSRNRREVLEASGFEVLNIKDLGLQRTRDINRLPEDASYRLAKEAYQEAPEADGIYIAGPAWPVVGNIAKLEDEFKKPVVANVPAQLRACLLAIGLREPIYGYGRLLEEL